MTVNGYTNGYTNGYANGQVGQVNQVNGQVNGVNGQVNGHANGANGAAQAPAQPNTSIKTRLAPAKAEEIQDLICVGFGPASLSVAVALHDALESGELKTPPKVLFLEKQERFAWHAGMLLPGAKMQISFVKDLATLRNPRSAFTFINYLHRNGRLVEFTNLGTFLPARTEYEDYLRWCAQSFDDSVVYSSEVAAVEADEATLPLKTFRVVVKNATTGVPTVYRARNVLMAVGGKPRLPPSLPATHARVLHSSQYAHMVPTILDNPSKPYRVAVLGAGQSAAEIFNNIQTLYPNSQTYLIMRSEFLKPSDDSPFVNSIFNPSYVDDLYPKPASYRKNLLAEARPTNYGVVRLELIEALYERMYHQRRVLGTDETKWPHRILGGHHVARVEATSADQLKVFVQRELSTDGDALEALDVDLIISATGYQRTTHVTMMQGLAHLLPETPVGKAADDAQNGIGSWVVEGKVPKVLSVSRDYHVGFAPGQVAEGSGVWLQGCCEGTHGLSDTLLSVLATRSGEIVESIFGAKA